MNLVNFKARSIPRCSQVMYDIKTKLGVSQAVSVRPVLDEISVKFTVPYVEAIVKNTTPQLPLYHRVLEEVSD